MHKNKADDNRQTISFKENDITGYRHFLFAIRFSILTYNLKRRMSQVQNGSITQFYNRL